MKNYLPVSVNGLIILFCSITFSAQQNHETKFLISSDRPAKVFIDKNEVGTIAENEYKIFIVSPGSHYVEAISLDGKWASQKRIYSVAKEHQEIVELKLTVPRDAQIGVVGSFADSRDNTTYKTVTINGQTWLAENLKYATKESGCYRNQAENCSKFGRHYTLNEARLNACPKGWHLPSKEEWEELLTFYPGSSIWELRDGGKSNFDVTRNGITYRLRKPGSWNDDKDLKIVGLYWANVEQTPKDDAFYGTALYLDEKDLTIRTFLSNQYEVRLTSARMLDVLKTEQHKSKNCETIIELPHHFKLGAGGMGEGYLAQDTKLDRRVALQDPAC